MKTGSGTMGMKTVKRAATLSLAAALLAGAAGIANADVRASLSQTQVIEGDSFVLNLQTDGGGSGAAPDLSVLQQDFDVNGTSQSSSTQIINGKVSQSQGWQITLTPKTTGTLTVPAIPVGDEETSPLEIEVVDAASVPRSTLGENGIEVEMTVEPGTYSAFNYSNVFEYLSAEQHERILELTLRAARPGARVAYWNLLVPRQRPASLAERLVPDPSRAAELLRQDRAFVYGGFQLETVQ